MQITREVLFYISVYGKITEKMKKARNKLITCCVICNEQTSMTFGRRMRITNTKKTSYTTSSIVNCLRPDSGGVALVLNDNLPDDLLAVRR